MLPLTKLLGGLSLISLSGLFLLYGIWQGEKANNEVLKSNIATLELSLETQRQSIQSLERELINKQESITQLITSNENSFSYLTEELQELNRLRVLEARKAYEQPYEAGTAYTNNVYDRMLFIANGAKDRGTD